MVICVFDILRIRLLGRFINEKDFMICCLLNSLTWLLVMRIVASYV